MKKKKHIAELAFFGAILILVLVILYSGLRILESTVLHSGQETAETVASKTITRNGVDYFPRQDITTILLMGIDQFGPVEDSGMYYNTGASDMNILLIFDEVAHTVTVLHLNRDTMVEMPVLGIGGRQAGTDYAQLALAHTQGSGLEDSCLNARKTVSALLYGVSIDYYAAMNMDAIAILNDAVGGVTVEVTEDFSAVDPSITMGTMALRGEQAITFVRSRQGVGDQMNVSRIERHKEYMDGFVDAFRKARESSPDLIVQAYEEVEPYLVTDCSANAISGMVDRFSDYEVAEVITPEGENVRGEYMEFHLDEEKLDQLILRLFYAEK